MKQTTKFYLLLQEKELWQSACAFGLAYYGHRNQNRLTGVPYIEHPMKVAQAILEQANNLKLFALDEIVAVAILHDFLEDVKFTMAQPKIITENFSLTISRAVVALSDNLHNSWEEQKRCFSESEIAVVVKFVDRTNNLSEMNGAWSKKKQLEYIDEAENKITPLYNIVKINENFVEQGVIDYFYNKLIKQISDCKKQLEIIEI